MKLTFTFAPGRIIVEGRCARCATSTSGDLPIPTLMITAVGLVNAMFKKQNVDSRIQIEIPGQYICEPCGQKLKENQYAEFTDRLGP